MCAGVGQHQEMFSPGVCIKLLDAGLILTNLAWKKKQIEGRVGCLCYGRYSRIFLFAPQTTTYPWPHCVSRPCLSPLETCVIDGYIRHLWQLMLALVVCISYNHMQAGPMCRAWLHVSAVALSWNHVQKKKKLLIRLEYSPHMEIHVSVMFLHSF